MNTTDPAAWESATFEGSRRAQLRRNLRLTVRQRLQNLEALIETSRRLANLTRGTRAGGTDPNVGARPH